MEKPKKKTEFTKASVMVGAGAGIGQSIGGSIGIAAFGGAVAMPLVVAGALVGLAGYGAYKACDSWFKEDSEESD